ncbi:hypothetical protein Tco_0812160, partial [Tanacetum coccineum]
MLMTQLISPHLGTLDEPQKKKVAETQPAEGTVVTANSTQSLGASESAEDQVNQPQTADAEK